MRLSEMKRALPLLLLAACAKQGFPPGGPVDKHPPQILSTSPEMGSINVPLDSEPQVVFSEAVDRASCEESIFITPYPGEGFRFKWRRTSLSFAFAEGLRPNRTYVITIGAGTRDRRDNSMKNSFSFAFSTGDSLDQGEMSGRVAGEGRIDGTQVWAYDLGAGIEPNPSQQDPLYVTQIGERGEYRLAYMAMSTYRLYAVLDRDLNSRYDAEYDMIGLTSADIHLAPGQETAPDVNFRLSVEDTTRPQLAAASALDRRHVDLRFSEPMRPEEMNSPSLYCIAGETDSLEVLSAAADARNSAYVHLLTAQQNPGAVYTVKAGGGRDLTGLALDPDSAQTVFTGSAVPDTLGARVIGITPADSAQWVELETTIDLLFSEAMDSVSVQRGFALADSEGAAVDGGFSWIDALQVSFSPEKELAGAMRYQVSLAVDSVLDAAGNSMVDTLFTRHFTTVDNDTLSEIAGVVYDADSLAAGPIHIHAQPVEGKSYDLWIPAPGPYRFTRILPGEYILELYRDRDSNGSYSYGQVTPFQPAERFTFYTYTISERSRWSNEGNDVILSR